MKPWIFYGRMIDILFGQWENKARPFGPITAKKAIFYNQSTVDHKSHDPFSNKKNTWKQGL